MILLKPILSKIPEKIHSPRPAAPRFRRGRRGFASARGQKISVPFQSPHFFARSPGMRGF